MDEQPPRMPCVVVVLGVLLLLGGIINALVTSDAAWAVLGGLVLIAAVAFGLAEAHGGGQ